VKGAVVAGLVLFATVLIVKALRPDDANAESNLWFLVGGAILLAPLLGGFVAGSGQIDRPLTHGAAATSLVAAAVLGVAVVRAVVRSRAIPIGTVLALCVILVSLGVVGGYAAFRRDLLRAGAEAEPGPERRPADPAEPADLPDGTAEAAEQDGQARRSESGRDA
jgi:hypothetical protein